MLAWGVVLLSTTQAQEGRRQELASQWAPVLFHDEAAEFLSPESGFNPVDTPLSFFFDENENLRDNGVNAFRLSHHQEVQLARDIPIYYSVIESRTHYYLNYVVYHAVDAKRDGQKHVHDTENILIIVEKSASGFGTWVGMVVNAHGFGMGYALQTERQSRWRARLSDQGVGRKFLSAIDPLAEQFDEHSDLEFVRRTSSMSPKVYVAGLSHALYKFNRDVWIDRGLYGSAYFPRACWECREQIDLDIAKGLRGILIYDLIDLDTLLAQAIHQNENFWVGKNRKRYLSSHYQERPLPGFLAPAWSESEAKVNLFYRGTFKTGIPLSDPARFHQFIEGASNGISQEYLYNPFVERRDGLIMVEPERRSQPHDLLFLADQFLNRLNF